MSCRPRPTRIRWLPVSTSVQTHGEFVFDIVFVNHAVPHPDQLKILQGSEASGFTTSKTQELGDVLLMAGFRGGTVGGTTSRPPAFAQESTDEDDRDHWTQVSIVPNATWWNGIHGLSNRHYGIAPCRGCQSSKPSHAQRAKIPHCSNKRCARRDDVDPLVLPARMWRHRSRITLAQRPASPEPSGLSCMGSSIGMGLAKNAKQLTTI